MSATKPLVSIGMPTHNGEPFIRDALNSLLVQDYEPFEIIISDNASTDQTEAICKEYCKNVDTVRYFRNDVDLGAAKNFNNLIHMAKGTYFFWAADHDLWHPSFISRCVATLDGNPRLALAYPRTMLIDMDGREVGLMLDEMDTRGLAPVHRYIHLIFNLGLCNMVYGVIRRDMLIRTHGFRATLGGDMVLLAELALKGEFVQLDEPLYFRRRNRPEETPEGLKKRVLADIDPIKANRKIQKPFSQLYRELCNEHLRMLARSALSPREKVYASLKTLECYRSRFGVDTPALSAAEKLYERFVPLNLRWHLSAWLRT